jgi:adenylosuccinate synthase
MPVVAVIGAQWGDEGKGKVVDLLAAQADMVVRFSGGNNAGHTIVNEKGEFHLHLVPSGIFNPEATSVIGNGVVLNAAALFEELDMLERAGVDTGRLAISDRAHLVMPYHLLLDKLEEQERGPDAIGTTLRGVGPAFVDKAARCGIRVGDLLSEHAFAEKLRLVLGPKNRLLEQVYGLKPLSFDAIAAEYSAHAVRLARYVCDTQELIDRAIEDDRRIMLEGAQGALLDPDFGTYPYVTSSSPMAGGATLGAGIPPTRIDRVIGLFKAYTTRVGRGPLPTELLDETGDRLRERAREYGTTTGRARRIGWFDGVAARYSARLNGFTGIAVTKLDQLDELATLKICVAYEADGRQMRQMPSRLEVLERCRPVYEDLPGWQTDTQGARSYADLPENAQNYLQRLSEIIGAPIDLVGVGPDRERTIILKPL